MKYLNRFLISCLFILSSIQYACEKKEVPAVVTTEVTEITATTAVCGGNITNDGNTTVTARGVCYSTNQNPAISDNKTSDGTGIGSFTSNITGLIGGTIYYVRAYATNSEGTGYGEELSLTTQLVDGNGNIYNHETIGTQVWMAENLKATKYNDGTAIPYVTNTNEWVNQLSPAYCWFGNNESANKSTYGALYNWYAATTGKLCPAGWHVPSDNDINILINFLGGTTIAGGKLKEAGTTYWKSPNTGADNSSGFTGLPAGYRGNNGDFFCLGEWGIWWSTNAYSETHGMNLEITYLSTMANNSWSYKHLGHSVRCIRND